MSIKQPRALGCAVALCPAGAYRSLKAACKKEKAAMERDTAALPAATEAALCIALCGAWAMPA